MRRAIEWLKLPGSRVELYASFGTLVGVWLGTTSTWGAVVYLFANAFWAQLIVDKKLWGLVPLTIATTVATIINLAKSL